MTSSPPDSLKKKVLSDAQDAVAGNDYVKLLRYRWARGLALVVGIAATAIGLAGGFERVEKPSPLASLTPQAPGATVDGGLYKMAVHSVWASHHTHATSAEVDTSYSGFTHGALHAAVSLEYRYDTFLPGVADVRQSIVWLRAEPDATPHSPQPPSNVGRVGGAELQLQPGVPTEAILTWRLPEGDSPVPARVRIGLMGYKFVPSSWLTQQPTWIGDKPAGIWDMPVQDRRPEERAAREASNR